MKTIDDQIMTVNDVICKNIDIFDISNRGLLSQNILSQLRNLVEYVSLKIFSNGQDIEITYENIKKAVGFIKSRGQYNFLSKFHKLLQISSSHYTLDEESSERLMLKYYEYLLKIKDFLKNMYNMNVLENIHKFPMKTDSYMKEYYEKIAEVINRTKLKKIENNNNDRYYIQKIKPFFVGNKVYYEVTFTPAHDYVSKFDRIIAYTKLDISDNYAVKLSISNGSIEMMGKNMPIQIIDAWEVSIRPCELNNFAKIFNITFNISSGNYEYRRLMNLLTTGINLLDIVSSNEDYYQEIKKQITEGQQRIHIFHVLEKCRELIINNMPGSNVIRYLLYRMNNKVIKQQYAIESCHKLSNLRLKYECIPFDQMPFASSLYNHNPKLSDIFDCIDTNDREHELLARLIKNNTEIKGQLYTHLNEIKGFDNIENLINKFNCKLYDKHYEKRKLERYNNYIYIKGYETDTQQIIEKLKELAQSGIRNYTSSVASWLQSTSYQIDCDEKKNALLRMFESSRVALIYGSAGTGKSTLINHISNFFNDRKKLYLANTNPAVDNLRRKVKASNCTFSTITQFLLSKQNTEYDLLFIDECSTVSNSDMLSVLNKASFKLLVLVGDIYQIESIVFGNWFDFARFYIPDKSIFELTKPYRSNNPKLVNLWNKVRKLDDDILEHLTRNNYSMSLNESIFVITDEDEIILCLNYDGFYGINNINRLLQHNNPNKPVQWGIQTYKINDPILFNETKRFAPLIYNNLKGRIVGIEKFEDKIKFDIEIDKVINELEAQGFDFQLLDNSNNGKSVIRFFVNKQNSTDDDDDSSDNIVPFQVAYAVSIHKAQGLEFNSVKLVIADEIEEKITHNIFYTAITRAKEKLKIYWTPETENKILKKLKKRDIQRDFELFNSKLTLQKQ